MTSLTWNYKSSYHLIACGIDAERVDRFIPYTAGDEHPMPFVFSEEEIRHCKKLDYPEKGFCAAFCSKEALFKALSRPYNFPECELFFCGDDAWQDLKLSTSMCNENRIHSAHARIQFFFYPSYMECLSAVYVFRE